MKKIIQFIILLLSISVSVQAANYDYLIVTTTKYTVAANRLKDWEASRGYKPYVMYMDNYSGWVNQWVNQRTGSTTLLSMGDHGLTQTTTKIRQFYTQNGMPKFLVVIGCDTDICPDAIHARDIRNSTAWGYHIYLMSDNEFGRQTKWTSSNYKSIPRGRISARTAQEAEDIIDKIIRYEWMPPTNSNYYSNALHMSLFQDVKSNQQTSDGRASTTWFDATVNINNIAKNRGISVDSIYYADYMDEGKQGILTPEKYYNGSLLPSNLRVKGPIWEKGPESIVNRINSGVMYALYNGGHGQVYGYSPTGKNHYQRFINIDPNSNAKTVASLTNVNAPTFFFNFMCWTGTFVGGGGNQGSVNFPRNCAAGENTQYLNDGCMCENLLRLPGGAVGAYGFAQSGVSNFNEVQAKYIMTDLLTSEKSVGECLFDVTGIDTWHQVISMYFGDPSSHMFTQVPRCIYPIISQSDTSVYVSTGGVSNCTIILNSLEDPSNTSRMKVATGSSANFTGVNYPYTITVKKHNYITYTGPDNLFIQNMTFNRARDVYGSTDIVAGKNVSSDYAQGNVTVSGTKVRFIAKHQVSLKSGFSVKNNGKFTASVQHYTCPTGGVRRAIINNDELADEDESMDRNTRNRFGIYPNPSDGIFTISLGEIDMPYTIEIIDMMGKVIYTQIDDQKEVVIDLSDKKSGIYHVKIFTNDNLWSNQVIIK
ncbi:MAG: C25 family cysteine peptidase [Bacteroidales bacterium]|nr:C25 family cysteine peptidase [Bacteroidales bacterium]